MRYLKIFKNFESLEAENIQIKVPYVVTADMSKYTGSAFNLNPHPFYISQKRREITNLGKSLGDSLDDSLVETMSRWCGFEPTTNLIELGLQLEEDIAILQNGVVKAILFCFPSGFIPVEKLGQNFFQMHQPVADNQKLLRASDKVTELISRPGAQFRRNVWTLTTSPKLSRHPIYKNLEPPVTGIDELYFRYETQTTVGLDNNISLFFVKVDVTKFNELPPDLQSKTVESLMTMPVSVLQYKGLVDIKKLF
jgi:hypothetical protein